MNSDLSQFEPSPSTWFEPNAIYEGIGRAEFQNPAGIAIGRAKAQFLETGDVSIELEIDDIETDFAFSIPGPGHLLEFLFPTAPVVTEKVEPDGRRTRSTSWSLGTQNGVNTCTAFHIETPTGVLLAVGAIDWWQEHESSLSFTIEQTVFEPFDVTPSAYWVLPLLNFVSSYKQRDSTLNRHPLRIYPTPSYPEGPLTREELPKRWIANSHNHLIKFEYEGELGFIERVPHGEENERLLHAGKERKLVTAVMVGAQRAIPASPLDVRSWVPVKLVRLLSLASGAEVGFLWIEFRDMKGNLSRRVHTLTGKRSYVRGHIAIDEKHSVGVGLLLSVAAKSERLTNKDIEAALVNTVRGALRSSSAEEKIGYLVRAIDSMAQVNQLNKPIDLTRKLTVAQRKQMEAIVDNASDKIRDLAEKGAIEDSETESRVASSEEAAILQRIAKRISAQTHIHRGFGEKVSDLLFEYGLPDEGIVDKYYEDYGGTTESWQDALYKYRSVVAHGTMFDFGPDGRHDIWDVWRIAKHLHDILLRLLLREFGYNGTYLPTVSRWIQPQSLDWVTVETPPDELGYQHD